MECIDGSAGPVADALQRDDQSTEIGAGPDHVTLIVESSRYLNAGNADWPKYEDVVFV